ncbi:hypothetical protein HDV05_000805 [Chytridiales sp. JEL 0842]|nr:hypothetical protein HDV05_000805 [Chytridiales sp. JEL 0842]
MSKVYKTDENVEGLRGLLLCKACSETLFEPVTLPCGNTVCQRCLRLPRLTERGRRIKEDLLATWPKVNKNGVDVSPPEVQNLVDGLLTAYICPAKVCRKRHQYRSERVDWIVHDIVESVFPAESKALHLVKECEQLLATLQKEHQDLFSSTIAEEGSKTEYALAEKESLQPKWLDAAFLQKRAHKYIKVVDKLFRAIELSPNLQLPYLVRAKALADLGLFVAANQDACHATSLNSQNRRGNVAQRLVEIKRRQAVGQETIFVFQSGKLALKMKGDEESATPMLVSSDSNDSAMEGVETLGAVENELKPPPAKANRLFDFVDCSLCLNTFVEPVTLPCGHSWCRHCVLAAIERNRQCPLCRLKLPGWGYFHKRPCNAILSEAARLLGTSNGDNLDDKKDIAFQMKLPMFVCTLSLPGTSQGFHLFEPRYRAMVKICIDNNKPFGLCLPAGFSYMQYGTAAEITHHEGLPMSELVPTSLGPLPRFVVECESTFRFKILRKLKEGDGLDFAVVERVEDIEPEDDMDNNQKQSPSWDPLSLCSQILRLRQFAKNLVESLPENTRRQFEAQYKKIPDDPAELTFWLSNILPLDPYQKYELLPLQRVKERADKIIYWINKLMPH